MCQGTHDESCKRKLQNLMLQDAILPPPPLPTPKTLLHFAEGEQVWDALLASSKGFISDPTEQFSLNKSTKCRRTIVHFGPAPCTCHFRLIEMHKRALLLS